MNTMCPVSFEKIDENIARLNAAQTALLLLIFLFSPWKWIILILAADFCIRGFRQPKFSLFVMISKKISAAMKLKPVFVDAAPKVFAARIGFFFCFLLIAAWILEQHAASWIIGLMFAACALMEATFRFCVACRIYPIVCKI